MNNISLLPPLPPSAPPPRSAMKPTLNQAHWGKHHLVIHTSKHGNTIGSTNSPKLATSAQAIYDVVQSYSFSANVDPKSYNGLVGDLRTIDDHSKQRLSEFGLLHKIFEPISRIFARLVGGYTEQELHEKIIADVDSLQQRVLQLHNEWKPIISPENTLRELPLFPQDDEDKENIEPEKEIPIDTQKARPKISFEEKVTVHLNFKSTEEQPPKKTVQVDFAEPAKTLKEIKDTQWSPRGSDDQLSLNQQLGKPPSATGRELKITMEKLASRPRVGYDDLVFALEAKLNGLIVERKINKLSSQQQSFISSLLGDLIQNLPNHTPRIDKLDQLKSALKKMIEDKNEQSFEIDRETFLFLTHTMAHHAEYHPEDIGKVIRDLSSELKYRPHSEPATKRVPGDVSSDLRKLKALNGEIEKGTWQEGEQRSITATVLRQHDLESLNETLDALFADADTQKVLTQFLNEQDQPPPREEAGP